MIFRLVRPGTCRVRKVIISWVGFIKTHISQLDLGTDLSSANNEHIQLSEYLCTLEHCNILKHLMISQILTY